MMENVFCFLTLNTAEVSGLIFGTILIILLLVLIKIYVSWSDPNRPNGPIFFVKALENRAMYVLKGSSFSGRVILASQRYCIVKEEDQYEIRLRSNLSQNDKSKVLSPFNLFGLYWIGIPPIYSIYYRKQEWQEWDLDTEKNRNILISRKEKTPYLIIVPFEYAMSVLEAESKNEVPLDVEFTVIVKPVNAVTPIFDNDDAYGQLQRFIVTTALLFIKTETFETLGGNVEEDGKIKEGTKKVEDRRQLNDRFSTTIKGLNNYIPGRKKDDKKKEGFGVKKLLGYEIIGAELNTVSISGDHKKELLKASTAKYVAEENAKALKAQADGERDAEISRAQGKEATLKVESDFLKTVAYIPGNAMKVVERRATPGLTTLVESDSNKKPLISVGK